jgi:hypothetical protein
MRTHPLYGHPHAIMSAEDLAPRTFERCMSDVTVAIGWLERLDLVGLDRDQRDRLTAAAARLKSCIWEMNHD